VVAASSLVGQGLSVDVEGVPAREHDGTTIAFVRYIVLSKKLCRSGEHLQPKTFKVRFEHRMNDSSRREHQSSRDEGAGVHCGAPQGFPEWVAEDLTTVLRVINGVEHFPKSLITPLARADRRTLSTYDNHFVHVPQ